MTARVTCTLTAHMKPYLRDALASAQGQTALDRLDVVVVDSGQWLAPDGTVLPDETSRAMSDIHSAYFTHPWVRWHFTGEGPDLRHQKCPVAWATNEVIRAGLVTGDYVCTFYDDDRWHPTFIEQMAGYLDDHPDQRAVWCSQHRIRLDRDGTETLIGVIPAAGPKRTGEWDCLVDGGQVMFRRDVLDAIGDPWLSEDPSDAVCRHSDGIFLERLGAVCGVVHPLPGGPVLYDHRFTPISTYTPTSRL